MEINTLQIVEIQKLLYSYSQDFSLDNDIRVAFYQANKTITSLVEELAKYKSLGSYKHLKRLNDNQMDISHAITDCEVIVNTNKMVNEVTIESQEEYVFDSLQKAVQFIQGNLTKNDTQHSVQKTKNEDVEKVHMVTYFDIDKLVTLTNAQSKKEFASSYIGEALYRIDIDPAMTNDGEDYEVKPFIIDAVEKYWDGNLVLMSGKEEVCLFDNIDTEKPFLDYYITFSSKEKAREYIEKRMEKESKGEERDDR